jgi:hypothetical protein
MKTLCPLDNLLVMRHEAVCKRPMNTGNYQVLLSHQGVIGHRMDPAQWKSCVCRCPIAQYFCLLWGYWFKCTSAMVHSVLCTWFMPMHDEVMEWRSELTWELGQDFIFPLMVKPKTNLPKTNPQSENRISNPFNVGIVQKLVYAKRKLILQNKTNYQFICQHR